MFTQFGKQAATVQLDSTAFSEPIRYPSDAYSPLILDSALHQAQHAALIAAGCESRVKEARLP
ncbi:MAG: hypothetical protein VX834_08200 [Myxococcota bacterium]|nr:hypothetical protein [Myxococcota bacterium]